MASHPTGHRYVNKEMTMTIGQIISALLLKAAKDAVARDAMKRDLFALLYGADEVQKPKQQEALDQAEALLKQYEKDRQLLHELLGVTGTTTGRTTSNTPQVQEPPTGFSKFHTSSVKTVKQVKDELVEALGLAGLDDCEVIELGSGTLGVNVGHNLPSHMTMADKIAAIQKIVNEVGTEPKPEPEPEPKTKAMPDVYQQDAALARLVRQKFSKVIGDVITITHKEYRDTIEGK